MPPPGQPEIAAKQISEALFPFGVFPDRNQIAKIREYVLLLIKWNQSLSLTSVTNLDDILGRHFGESMFASNIIKMEQCRLVDIGTGAGFPGLALKIIRPDIRLTLIESNKKKCAFLSEVARILGLAEVEIVAERFEQIRPEGVHTDIVTSRAVGEFKQLLRWSRNALAHRGHLILWVGSEDSTRIASTPNWIWQPAVKIPDSQRRLILVGRPVEDLPPQK